MTPFLQSFQFRDWKVFDLSRTPVFDFTRGLKCISIRDQIVRSVLLARDLNLFLEQEDIDQADIGIVGAGVCGIACAIELANSGHSIVVYDKNKKPFELQGQCSTRWIDPTQYDWPINHWKRGRFPCVSSLEAKILAEKRVSIREFIQRSPFRYPASFASELASIWSDDFRQFVEHNDSVSFRSEEVSFAICKDDAGNDLYALHPKGDPVNPQPFDAIINAQGFGVENCELESSPKFKGIPFWSNDPFELENCELNQKPTVLISGSGDGALQDLLRITTKQSSAKAIYELLELPGKVSTFVESEILCAECINERAFNNSSGREFSACYFQHAHDVHSNLAQFALDEFGTLRDTILKLIEKGPAKTYLVNSSPFFNCQYPLNRFLTTLFVAACRGNGDKIEWIKGRTAKIDNELEQPEEVNETDCIGGDWTVHIEEESGIRKLSANVIIIRHGFKRQDVAADEKDFPNCLRPVPPSDLRFCQML